jgi:hypothetical protein
MGTIIIMQTCFFWFTILILFQDTGHLGIMIRTHDPKENFTTLYYCFDFLVDGNMCKHVCWFSFLSVDENMDIIHVGNV